MVAYRGTVVLHALNLTIEPGEIMALIGPSGSGKTTALRAVAGFVRPTQRPHPHRRARRDRPAALRAQHRHGGAELRAVSAYAGRRECRRSACARAASREQQVRERVRDCLRMVGMRRTPAAIPRELSGGQQQRVAIARALAIRPQVLLLDEPLSALDAQIRRAMLDELARLHRELPSLTVLYVTHDQTEALTLADRIAIMRDGRLMALGPSQGAVPRAAEPLRRRVPRPRQSAAGPAGGGGPDGLARVRFGDVRLLARARPGLPPGGDCLLCVRPHDINLDGQRGG